MKKGWELKKLEEVCGFQNGYSFKSNLYKSSGLPILRISNIQNDKIETSDIMFFHATDYHDKFEKYQVRKGDLVIAMSGGTTGKLGINTTNTVFYLNQRVGKFLPKKELSKDYLYYYLSTKVEESLEISAGSAQPNLSLEQINNFVIPIPSLSEQQRIVSMLDEAFASIAQAKSSAEQNLVNARELFDSILGEIFENKRWKTKKLCDLGKYDKTPNKRKRLPYIGLEDIESNSGRFLGSMSPRNVKSSTFYFTQNHVLYGRLRPYLNKVLLPNFEGHCSTEIFPILPNNVLNRGYLFFWLISGATVKKINSTSTGTRMPRANMNAVLDFEIPIPTLIEQRTIVKRLQSLSAETKKLEHIYQSKINDIAELKKSILAKAFSGEL